jgi:hypothetical protein
MKNTFKNIKNHSSNHAKNNQTCHR